VRPIAGPSRQGSAQLSAVQAAVDRPYALIVDINVATLPPTDAVRQWDSARFLAALVHTETNPEYDQQFLHVSFKIAAACGPRFTGALEKRREIIAQRVRNNLLDKHIAPLFL